MEAESANQDGTKAFLNKNAKNSSRKNKYNADITFLKSRKYIQPKKH